jgi:Na+-transporting NADH:ubiquinone oxidoreductase subunit NqrC
MIVVADLYQLGRSGGVFDTNLKLNIVHAKAKVQKEYVEEINASAIDSGRYYVIDEESTELFSKAQKEKHAKLEAKKEVEKLSKEDLLDVIVEKKTRTRKTKVDEI